MSQVAAVAGGGALGAVARLLVSAWALEHFGTAFAYGTLAVNVVGSLLLGVIVGAATNLAGVSPVLVGFAGTGFCGAFTTFSTYAVETLTARPMIGLLNLVATNALTLGAAALGLYLGTRVAAFLTSAG